MKVLRKNLSLILIAFAAVFFIFQVVSSAKPAEKKKQVQLLGTHYRPKEQKPFVIIIPSFNNEKYCLKNLSSVLEQNYKNYRVIYIDDASTDATFGRVEKIIKAFNAEEKVTLIRNKSNQKAMANCYRAIHTCRDDEIVAFLNGDDWLAHDNVLNYLNIAYENSNIWLTYGSYILYPSYKRGRGLRAIPDHMHEKRSYRDQAKNAFALQHLRTAYAGLLKQVRLSDVLHEGHFYQTSFQEALMLPLIEMAGKHSRCMRDILYVYNRETPLAEDKMRFDVKQQCLRAILSQSKYKPRIDWKRIPPDPKVDLVIHSKDSPMELLALLESLESKVRGARMVSIYYKAGEERYEKAYQEIACTFPFYHFMPLEGTWDTLLQDLSANGEANYLLALRDGQLFKRPVDLVECVDALFSTRAGCFILSEAPIGIAIHKRIRAFQRQGAVDFDLPVLFPTQELASGHLFAKGTTLEFEEEKTATLELAESPDSLLTKFESGLKIDIFSLYRALSSFVNLDSGRQSKIDPSEEASFPIGKSDEEGRFGKVVARPNLQNLAGRGITPEMSDESLFIVR